MKRWALVGLLTLLSLFLAVPSHAVANGTYPYLTLSFDRGIYHPGETAILTITINDAPTTMTSATVELRFDPNVFGSPNLADTATMLTDSVMNHSGVLPDGITREATGAVSISLTQNLGLTSTSGALFTLALPVKQYAPDVPETWVHLAPVMPGMTDDGVLFLEPQIDTYTQQYVMVELPEGTHENTWTTIFKGGSIGGTVRLAGRYEPTAGVWSNQGGVSVWVIGHEMAAETDATGEFILDYLPTGTYDLLFSKPGYLTARVNGVPASRGVVRSITPLNLVMFPGNIGDSVSLDAVFLEDLALLARAIGSSSGQIFNSYYSTSYSTVADLDGDGSVGAADLGLMAENWGRTGSQNGANPTPSANVGFPEPVPATTSMTLTLSQSSVAYTDVVRLTAKLSAADTGITDLGYRMIEFQITPTTDFPRYYFGATDALGQTAVDAHIDLPGGPYTVTARFYGDADLAPVIQQTSLTVVPEAATLEWHGPMENPGGVQYLTVGLKQEEDGSFGDPSGALVQFTVTPLGGTAATYIAPIWYGEAQLALSMENVPYTVGFELVPNDYFTAASSSFVLKAHPMLTVVEKYVGYSDAVLLTATVSPKQSGRTIRFFVNGSSVGTATTNAEGVAELSYTANLLPNSYSLEATLEPDEYTMGSTVQVYIYIEPDAVGLTYTGTLTTTGPTDSYGQVTVTLQGRVVHVDGTPGPFSSADAITFDVRDAYGNWAAGSQVNLLTDGSATTTVKLDPGAYVVQLGLISDRYYVPSPTVVNLTGPSQITLGMMPRSTAYSDPFSMGIGLTYNGLPLSGKTVTLAISGSSTTAVTDVDGNATLTIESLLLPPGEHLASITYTGDATIPPARADLMVMVSTEEAAISSFTAVRNSDGSLSMQASLTEVGDGTPGDLSKAGLLQFSVLHPSTRELATAPLYASPGQPISTGSLANVPYIVQASLPEGGFYWAFSHEVSVPMFSTLSLTAPAEGLTGQLVSVETTLTSIGSGLAFQNQAIVFSINGSPIATGNTDYSGYLGMAVQLPSVTGSATITASFAGDTNLAPASASKTVTVVAPAVMTMNVGVQPTAIPNDGLATATVTATLLADGVGLAGQLVDFMITGPNGYVVYSDAATGDGGSIAWAVGPFGTAGAYTITAAYAGDATHGAVSGTATLTVQQPAPTSLTVTLYDSDYYMTVSEVTMGNFVVVEAAYPTPYAGSLSFYYLDGTTLTPWTSPYTLPVDQYTGKAMLGLDTSLLPSAGIYTLKVIDSNGVSDTATLTVNPPPPTSFTLTVYDSSHTAATSTVTMGTTVLVEAAYPTPYAGNISFYYLDGGTLMPWTWPETLTADSTTGKATMPLDTTLLPSPGTYTLKAIDANGVSSTATLAVEQPASGGSVQVSSIAASNVSPTSADLTVALTAAADSTVAVLLEYSEQGTNIWMTIATVYGNGSNSVTHFWTAPVAGGSYDVRATIDATTYVSGQVFFPAM